MVYTFICKNCGKQYRAKTRRSRYCCEKCRREADKERKRIEYGASREEKVCPECGETFTTKSSASNFCSKICSAKFARKRKKNKIKFEAGFEEELSLKNVFLREKGICYLCGGNCEFQDVILQGEFLAPGNAFPVIDFITEEQNTATVKLAHYYCKKEKDNGKL